MNHTNNELAIRALTDAEPDTVGGGANVVKVVEAAVGVVAAAGALLGAAIVYEACNASFFCRI